MKTKKIQLECLVDSKTGRPISLEIPTSELKKFREISLSGWRSGQRLKMALESVGAIAK